MGNPASFLFFFQIQIASADNSTNVTNTTANYTLPPIQFFIGKANITVYGEVINRTFLPPFQVQVPGILNCSFVPIDTPQADRDRYETSCDYPANLSSKDQIYVPLPLPLLKNLENITEERTELAKLRGENQFLWIALIAAIITTVGVFVMSRLDELKEEVQ